VVTGGFRVAGRETGGAGGADRVPPSPFGGSATRGPTDEPLDVDVAEDPVLVALARPAKPIAAIAEKTAESVSETAMATRVIRETARMPFSRVRPILFRFPAVRLLDRMPVMRRRLGHGGLSSVGILFEIHVKALKCRRAPSSLAGRSRFKRDSNQSLTSSAYHLTRSPRASAPSIDEVAAWVEPTNDVSEASDPRLLDRLPQSGSPQAARRREPKTRASRRRGAERGSRSGRSLSSG
jgi:hypothetical protein